MKKTITHLTLILALVTLSLETKASQLYLQTSSFHARATIGGDQFFTTVGQFDIQHIRPGNHHMIVFDRRRKRGNRNGYSGSRPLFRGRIFIPAKSIVYARITPHGRLIISQVIPMRKARKQRYDHPRRNTHPRYRQPNRGNRDYRTPPNNRNPRYRNHNQRDRDWDNRNDENRDRDNRDNRNPRDWENDWDHENDIREPKGKRGGR